MLVYGQITKYKFTNKKTSKKEKIEIKIIQKEKARKEDDDFVFDESVYNILISIRYEQLK